MTVSLQPTNNKLNNATNNKEVFFINIPPFQFGKSIKINGFDLCEKNIKNLFGITNITSYDLAFTV